MRRIVLMGIASLAVVVSLVLPSVIGSQALGERAQPPVASAQVFNVAGTLSSGFQVQNLDTSSVANVRILYYDQNGSVVCSPSTDCETTVAPGRQKTFLPGAAKTETTWPMAVPEGFRGSAVVESDRQIAVIVNLQSSGPVMWGSYSGVGSPSRSQRLPLLAKNNSGWSTKVYIQNAGDVETTVTLSLTGKVRSTGQPQNTSVTTPSLKKGAVYEIDQATMSQLSNGWLGAGVATATNGSGKVAVIVNYSNNAQVLSYSGFNADGGSVSVGQKLYASIVQNDNSGWWSGIQVMNVGSSAGSASLVVNGKTVATTPTLQPNESFTWLVTHRAGAPWTSLPRYFSAVIQGSGGSSWVGMVTQTSDAGGGGMAYGLVSQGASRVVAPLLMSNNSNWNTGLQIMNVGSTTASGIKVRLDGKEVKSDLSLAPGASAVFLGVNPHAGGVVDRGGNLYVGANGASWFGAGEVIGPSGSQLIATVNELNTVAGGENAMTYEAFAAP